MSARRRSEPRERLSQRAYAKHRGVTHAAVAKALRAGRIHLERDGRIDPLRADREWEENTSPVAAAKRKSSRPTSSAVSFARERARKMATDARRAELELAQLEGNVMSIEDAERSLASTLQQLRAGIVTLPARESHVLAAELGVTMPAASTVLQALANRLLEYLRDGALAHIAAEEQAEAALVLPIARAGA